MLAKTKVYKMALTKQSPNNERSARNSNQCRVCPWDTHFHMERSMHIVVAHFW